VIATSKLRKAMREIAAKKGEFSLFGIFLRSNSPGTWDLVVSAPWLEKGKLKTLREFTELLSESMGEQALRKLAPIVILNEGDPAVKAVISAFSVDDGEVRVSRSNLFGLEIEDAIILRAKRAA
jgi:hypothetical protein